MYINDDLKAIFLHNPKCGGVYIRELLETYYGFRSLVRSPHKEHKHFIYPRQLKTDEDLDSHTIRNFGLFKYYESHQDCNLIDFKKYFVFTFVRNPYEKLYSAYLYLKRKLQEHPAKDKIRNTYENQTFFTNFLCFIKNRNNVNNISYFHAFIPQYEQMLNYSNSICVNYIGRTETLTEDLLNILTILNISDIKHIKEVATNLKLNSSDHEREPILDVYDEESFHFVNDYFRKDFEIFGYKRYKSYEEFKSTYSCNTYIPSEPYCDWISTYKLSMEVKHDRHSIIQTNQKLFEVVLMLMNELKKSEYRYTYMKEINNISLELRKLLIDETKHNVCSTMESQIVKVLTKVNQSCKTSCSICKIRFLNKLANISHTTFCNEIKKN